MATLENTSLSDEPALSGWWIVACFSAAGLILLFAALIQQASRLSDTLFTLFPDSVQEPLPETLPETLPVSVQEPVQKQVVETVAAAEAATEAEAELKVPEALQNVDSQLSVEGVDSNVLGNEAAFADDGPALEAEVLQLGEDTLAVTDSGPSTDELSANLPEDGPEDGQDDGLGNGPDSSPDSLPINEAISSITDSDADTSVAEAVAAEPVENANLALTDGLNTTESVDDELEAQTSAELSLASLRRSVLTEMNLRSKRISFEPASSELSAEGERLLGQVFEDLFLYAEADIVVEVGSLDSTADSTNRLLSDDRANTIRDFLINRGIEAERLVISLLPDSFEFNEQQFVNIQANL